LRFWKFEGSIDSRHWELLREHIDDKKLNKKGATHNWSLVQTKKAFRFFRITQTGPNSNGNHYLALSGVELYGTCHQEQGKANLANKKVLRVASQTLKFDPKSNKHNVARARSQSLSSSEKAKSKSLFKINETKEFVFSSDFDKRGIMYYLGTKGYTQAWQNPGVIGAVNVTSTPLASHPPSEPSWAIVGRDIIRCVTVPGKESWFMIDLLHWRVCPTAYTLRHYSSWDTEALRDWKLQGSNDGKKWSKLLSHKKDCSLNKKGESKTWAIPRTKKAFRFFRILQTGKNSNGHWYCALSGFEVYGTLSSL